MIAEWSEQQLRDRMSGGSEPFALFVFTPLCGTCKAGARMLEVVQHMRPAWPIAQANVNYMPAFVREWQIESIPCLLVIHQGRPVLKTYAMRSVDHLLRLLTPLLIEEG